MLFESKDNSGERFESQDLSAQDLTGYEFEDCSFTKCNFCNANLIRARFLNCKFDSCDLSSAKLNNGRVRDVSFQNCKLLGLQWVQLEDLTGPSFKDCNLAYSNFSGLKVKKTQFLKCNLRDADFASADFTESTFKQCDLLNARFASTTLVKCDFRGAINYLISPIDNKLKGARFSFPEAQGLLQGLGIILDSSSDGSNDL